MKSKFNELTIGVRRALIAGCAVLAPVAMPAYAQQSEDAVELDKVEVTGSRIRRVDAETASPVFVVERSAIERSGAMTVGELIQDIPAIAGAATNPSVNNGGGDGASTVSLRGLTEDRTLLLLDGRRMVTNDVNAIPVAMIERIEVLKDGASAIYGSDAIGGVINFIFKRDFEGAIFDFNYGLSDRDDGERAAGSAVYGFTGDRGNAMFSINYNDQKAVLAQDRDFSAFALYLSSGVVSRAGSSSTPRGRYTLPAAVAQANGLGSCVGGSGVANVTRIEGRNGTSPSDFRCYVGGSTDAFNYQGVGNVELTPQERYGVAFSGEFEIVEGVNAFMDVHTQNTRSAGIIAPLPFFSDFDGIALDGDSIYNPFGATINGRYRILGLGNRSYNYETDVKEITSGFEGGFGDTSWTWEAAFTYGKIAQENQDRGYIDYSRLADALGPSFIQNGTPRCGTPSAPIAGCVPINFFNQPDPATAEGQAQIAALQALLLPVRDNTDTTLKNFSLNFSGDVMDLTAGTMSAAFGFEHRKQSLVFAPDAIKYINTDPFGCGISSESCADPTRGDTTVKEVYGELYIPVLDRLAFTLGSRWSDYDSFGNTTNSKLGLEWRAIDDLLVRATYAEVFRAPTINDLFQGARITNPVYSDPCNGQPLSCVGLPNVPGVVFEQGLGQTNALLGGNPALDPDTGDVFTWGFVYSPSWLSGFSVAVDVWDVHLEDTIQSLGTQPILNTCFQSGDLCNLFTRNPQTGDVFLVNDITQNAGVTDTNGVDIGFRYSIDTDWGLFRASIDSTYIDRYDVRVIAGGVTIAEQENAGTFLPSSKGGLGNYSRWRSLAAMNWSLGNFEAQWTTRYVDGFRVGSYDPEGDCADNAGRGVVGNEGCVFFRGATTYHNLQFGYNMPEWHTKLQFGIDNAFDKQPPILYQNNSLNGNIDERTHDPVGRYYWVNATLRF
ncbi:MAG: TonB-dependent receptor [Xanthomonadales bacterium]|nr:TonB-dependent receptor [Xanthomonadales bacterium]